MASEDVAQPAASGAEQLPVLIGEHPAMQAVHASLARFATREEPVLITGETGTGKEVVARQLHARGPRAGRPFVALNCAALSESLAEAELFGHARGAFTGAVKANAGLLAEADDGTLLLDEIDSLSPRLQGMLLRVIEYGDYHPLGERRARRLRARVLAACNRPLTQARAEGSFRNDLYFRLHRLAIDLPPLRARGEDILLLARHFLATLGGPTPPALDPALERRWLEHPWEGNVRELRNEVEYLLMVHAGETVLRPAHSRIGAATLSGNRRATRPPPAAPAAAPPPTESTAPAGAPSIAPDGLLLGTAADRRQARIAELASRHPRITRKNVVDQLGCAPHTAARDLRALVAAGILIADHDRAGRAVAYRHADRTAGGQP